MTLQPSRFVCVCVLLSVARLAIATDPAAPLSMTLSAPSPRMVRATVDGSDPVEWERQPAIGRIGRDRGLDGHPFQRHEAEPDTRYRYRARRAGGAWSEWMTVRTPPAAAHTPAPPTMLEASAARRFVVSLHWQAGDQNADGFVLLRCDAERTCFVAALLDPDERRFDYHTVRAGHYRIAAFNAHGYSSFSEPTALVGVDEMLAAGASPGLHPEDSVIARGITVFDENSGRLCTTPKRLIADGWRLQGVRASEDIWQQPESCGTGGCVWYRFKVDAGCYRTDDSEGVLSTTPAYSGTQDSPGIVITNSSGSAATGQIVIYEGGGEIDRYDWHVIDPPYPGTFPPFNQHAATQFAESVEFSPD